MLFVPAQWKFGSKIGCGTFGVVWAGLFRPNNRNYAVKKIKQSSENAIEEVQREVQLMASMGGHRNVVRYFGGSLVNNTFFWIVMELMECGTLADVMSLLERPFSAHELAPLARDVCAGLGYLHNLGIIHKDLVREQNFFFFF
jgi:serine/threonine protein kinase